MTEIKKAKEKAKELTEVMYAWNQTESAIVAAKECAIIVVDQIIKEIPMYTGNLNPKWEYWQAVKDEINKLK